MLLGAAIAAGDAELLRHAFRDRLHEPFRAAGAPLFDRVSGRVREAPRRHPLGLRADRHRLGRGRGRRDRVAVH